MKTTICNVFYISYILFTVFTFGCHRSEEESIPADQEPGFVVNDFSKSSVINVIRNSEVRGATMVMFYKRGSPEAEIGNREHFDVSKGFESSFTFAGSPGNYLQIRVHAMDGSLYNPYGISTILDETVFNIGHSITNIVVRKSMPTLFDGKKHTVKIQVQNLPDQALRTKIFVDNMDEAAFMADDSTLFDRQELYVTGPKARRRVSLLYFNYDSDQGELTLYNWSFKPL